MPRRAKPAGAQYANRSDLQAQAPTAATGLPYGEHQQLINAQRALPVAPGAAPGGVATPDNPSVGAPDPMAALMDAAQRSAPPDNPLAQPSFNPSEPVTAGMPIGAGTNSSTPLNVQTSPDPDIVAFAKWMPMLEMAASQPDASSSLRALVFRVRGQMPVNHDYTQGA